MLSLRIAIRYILNNKLRTLAIFLTFLVGTFIYYIYEYFKFYYSRKI